MGIVRARNISQNKNVPLLLDSPRPASASVPLPNTPQKDTTVAVAEDPFVRRYVRALLLKHGFHIVENDSRVTRKLMESGELKPDVLVTNDPACFAGFAGVPVVYIAAAPDPELVVPFKLVRMVRKPFEGDQLLRAVSELAACAVA